jgi:excisionase family DNA binding protein
MSMTIPHPALGQLVDHPDQIVAIPRSDIPRLIGDAEALKARLWARLQECATPVAAEPSVQRGNGPHRLLTAGQAAERLDVTLARLYELARTGALPAVRIGRQIRFSPDALSEWIEGGGQSLAGGWRRERE